MWCISKLKPNGWLYLLKLLSFWELCSKVLNRSFNMIYCTVQAKHQLIAPYGIQRLTIACLTQKKTLTTKQKTHKKSPLKTTQIKSLLKNPHQTPTQTKKQYPKKPKHTALSFFRIICMWNHLSSFFWSLSNNPSTAPSQIHTKAASDVQHQLATADIS